MTGSTLLRRTAPALAVAALAALGLAACSGSNGYGAAAPPTTPASGTAAGLAVASTADGSVLVDGSGHAIYLLTADHTNASTCTGACMAAWPVVPATSQHASGVTATLGSLTRGDGTKQLTVDGMPAYTYAADQGAGDVNGQGVSSFGGTWWLLSASGAPVKSSGGGSASTPPMAGY